jgi:phage tail sheath protein FI
MIDSYLYTLWQRGALRGTKAEEAYFVNVGAKTMTPDEILNGYLIVEIGLAAVRPAEFIILRFSHKVNQ